MVPATRLLVAVVLLLLVPATGAASIESADSVGAPSSSCDLVWVYPTGDERIVDFGINEYFLECIGNR